MPRPDQERTRRTPQFAVLAALTVTGFGAVTLGLLTLQVTDHDRYVELSKENRVRLEVLRAPRGAIYDRHGTLLADSAPSFGIVFRPFPAESTRLARATRDAGWLTRVATLVQLDTAEVRRRVTFASRSGQTAMLRRDAPFGVRAAIEESRADLPGIEVQVEPIRHYPNGTLAGHLLGYAGEVTQDELDHHPDYVPGDLIGRTGVESSYEDMLRGRDGAEFVVVNAMGRRVSTLEEEPRRNPLSGHNLVLTLDMKVQRALEDAMSGVDRGAAVALDPRDGGILALVSRPTFDPNEFSHGLSWARWQELSQGGANPLLDRAIQGAYPPGSTFKVVTMTAALKHGVATPESRQAPCPGGMNYGGRWFSCWEHRGHGSLTLLQALQKSCDVYFYQLGLKLGLPHLEETARGFGLGQRTGVDLPQERRGLVPSTAYYDKRWGAGRWRSGLLLNLAIGQGELLVTPLQLATMLAEVTQDGRPVRPHIVQRVGGVQGWRRARPVQTGVTAEPATWNAVRQALQMVVEGGTANAARVPGIGVAGKTGTAQNPHGRDHALFICYAPTDRPQIVMAMVVENSGHGGSVAAPIAGAVLRRLYLPDSLQGPPRLRPPAELPAAAADSAAEDSLAD
jgi:penicillin-binding protein 2